MNKEEEMREAIKNFHRVYYEGGPDKNTFFTYLHHAAEHLFNAADITVSDRAAEDLEFKNKHVSDALLEEAVYQEMKKIRGE